VPAGTRVGGGEALGGEDQADVTADWSVWDDADPDWGVPFYQ